MGIMYTIEVSVTNDANCIKGYSQTVRQRTLTPSLKVRILVALFQYFRLSGSTFFYPGKH